MASHTTWPTPMLQDFTVLMAGHGFSVSGTLMNHDKGYAIEQLKHAHTMADDHLRQLAVQLFRYVN